MDFGKAASDPTAVAYARANSTAYASNEFSARNPSCPDGRGKVLVIDKSGTGGRNRERRTGWRNHTCKHLGPGDEVPGRGPVRSGFFTLADGRNTARSRMRVGQS